MNENPDTLSPEENNTAKEKDPILSRLKFKPLKDIILFVIAGGIIGVILLAVFLSKPKDSTGKHVEIYYQNTQLWDKEDATKSLSISFPSSGEKRITYSREDGPIFLGEGHTFEFQGSSVTFTLYSDQSIELKQEDVTCPNHDCSKTGRVYNTLTPIVCLPNSLRAMIVSDSNALPEWDN